MGQLHFPEHHLVAAAPAEAAREAYMVPGCLLAALGLDLELELKPEFELQLEFGLKLTLGLEREFELEL